jgi:hypothetical protein
MVRADRMGAIVKVVFDVCDMGRLDMMMVMMRRRRRECASTV